MDISDVAAIATAGGVVVGAIQLVIGQRQSVTSFEDSLNHEYRKLAPRLPTQALTYHGNPGRWVLDDPNCLLRSVAKGQEFVLDIEDRPEATDWINGLVAGNQAQY